MKIAEIAVLANGMICNPSMNLEREVNGACGADLMSDVLASVQPEAVLLTGLCNPQVVRTAHMADVRAIVFVRGKQPPPETIKLASKEGIPLIVSPYGLYELCGRLFQAGLASLEGSLPADCYSCEE